MPKGKSLFHEYPDHKVILEPSEHPARATLAGTVIAESARPLLVREADYPAVVYFPRDDVRLDLADRTAHETFCPFKGEASYWTFTCSDPAAENVAWSYEDPFEEVIGLKGFVAFYAELVVIEGPA